MQNKLYKKFLLRILLLSIVVINNTNCSRRAPRHTGNGRRVSQEVKKTQTNPHQSNNAVQAVPITSKKVDKTKPNIEQIKHDLVGHSLSEGVNEGYYPSFWKWTIREGEISNFCIERVVEDSFAEYEFVSSMRLTSRAGKSFDAKVRLCYVFSETQGWNLQFVQSQGMHVVKTGKYNDCIKIEKDQFFFVFCK